MGGGGDKSCHRSQSLRYIALSLHTGKIDFGSTVTIITFFT